MKPLTYGDLPEQAGDKFLVCTAVDCERYHERFSATRGDYFMMLDAEPIVCDCGEYLQLARAETRIIPVSQ
jgi:hypothetical protein